MLLEANNTAYWSDIAVTQSFPNTPELRKHTIHYWSEVIWNILIWSEDSYSKWPTSLTTNDNNTTLDTNKPILSLVAKILIGLLYSEYTTTFPIWLNTYILLKRHHTN